MPSRAFEPADGARFTIFHVYWIALTLAAASFAWFFSRPLGTWWSLAIAIGALVIAVPLCGLLVMLAVTFLIPRLTPGSQWSREVNAYMLAMLGREWADAGKPRADDRDDSDALR